MEIFKSHLSKRYSAKAIFSGMIGKTRDVGKVVHKADLSSLRSSTADLFELAASDFVEIAFNCTTAREKLCEERFEALWAEGRAMSMEEAIKYALEEDGDA